MTTITSHQDYQDHILPGVSRTFALTIPQLPAGLRNVVTNAYLLCRIADTIEDDATLAAADKTAFHDDFIKVVAGRLPARQLATRLAPELGGATPAAERDLIENMDRILALTHRFNDRQHAAMTRCIRIMCHGMAESQQRMQPAGLPSLTAMDRYCYYVAGVVGEMLTELFCNHAPEINRHRGELMRLAPSFGKGLQMTNILKDVRADRSRGVCWLPRDIFDAVGCDLSALASGLYEQEFTAGMNQLIPIAHSHLHEGLNYTLRIPPQQVGIRHFCLWALGMAVMSLRKIHHNPAFVAVAPVKISHTTVKATIVITNMATQRDHMLRQLFRWSSHGLNASTYG